MIFPGKIDISCSKMPMSWLFSRSFSRAAVCCSSCPPWMRRSKRRSNGWRRNGATKVEIDRGRGESGRYRWYSHIDIYTYVYMYMIYKHIWYIYIYIHALYNRLYIYKCVCTPFIYTGMIFIHVEISLLILTIPWYLQWFHPMMESFLGIQGGDYTKCFFSKPR